MCLLFFSYQYTPGYRIVIAANRDEFYSRPTEKLSYFDGNKTILCGRDLKEGGTWLGVTTDMKFGAITNFREQSNKNSKKRSRGMILLDYFSNDQSSDEFVGDLAQYQNDYEGFNLVVGDTKKLFYYSNKLTQPQLLGPGFYGLSNHFLDSGWPKITRGKKLLFPHMVQTDQVKQDKIFPLLQDTWKPSDADLPETGVGLEWERILSPIFVQSPTYGCRSSAVITISLDGSVDFFEKGYKLLHEEDSSTFDLQETESVHYRFN